MVYVPRTLRLARWGPNHLLPLYETCAHLLSMPKYNMLFAHSSTYLFRRNRYHGVDVKLFGFARLLDLVRSGFLHTAKIRA